MPSLCDSSTSCIASCAAFGIVAVGAHSCQRRTSDDAATDKVVPLRTAAYRVSIATCSTAGAATGGLTLLAAGAADTGAAFAGAWDA